MSAPKIWKLLTGIFLCFRNVEISGAAGWQYRCFRNRLRELEQPGNFEREAERAFRFHGNKAIVWNGFQFLTPIQKFVYDCFVKSGYSIYALIQDEKKYPYANEIWRHLYNESNGYPPYEDWIRFEDPDSKIRWEKYLKPGKDKCSECENNQIQQYDRICGRYLQDPGAGFYLYSADDYTANRMLKDYFPERYEVKFTVISDRTVCVYAA